MNENYYHKDETFNMSYKDLYYNLYGKECIDNQYLVKCELYNSDNNKYIYIYLLYYIY